MSEYSLVVEDRKGEETPWQTRRQALRVQVMPREPHSHPVTLVVTSTSQTQRRK